MFHDVSWCFMMFHDVSWCFMMFHDVSWCFMMFQVLVECFGLFCHPRYNRFFANFSGSAPLLGPATAACSSGPLQAKVNGKPMVDVVNVIMKHSILLDVQKKKKNVKQTLDDSPRRNFEGTIKLAGLHLGFSWDFQHQTGTVGWYSWKLKYWDVQLKYHLRVAICELEKLQDGFLFLSFTQLTNKQNMLTVKNIKKETKHWKDKGKKKKKNVKNTWKKIKKYMKRYMPFTLWTFRRWFGSEPLPLHFRPSPRAWRVPEAPDGLPKHFVWNLLRFDVTKKHKSLTLKIKIDKAYYDVSNGPKF